MSVTGVEYTYHAVVQRVVDGDTIDVDVVLIDTDLGFHHHAKTTQQMRLRLAGINAPESNTIAGSLATKFLQSILPMGGDVVIATSKDKAEKYGRYLAWVWLPSGKCINDEMLSSGNAVEYNPSGIVRPPIPTI